MATLRHLLLQVGLHVVLLSTVHHQAQGGGVQDLKEPEVGAQEVQQVSERPDRHEREASEGRSGRRDEIRASAEVKLEECKTGQSYR